MFIVSNYCCYSQVDSLIVGDITKIDSLKSKNKFIQNEESAFELTKSYYSKHSVFNKKVGNTFLNTGLVLIVGGLIIGTIIEKNRKNYDGLVVAATGLFFGSIACVISIPFFISSNHNAKLAKSLP